MKYVTISQIKKSIIYIILITTILLSGCVDRPSRSDLEDSVAVDLYCQSKGYDYGATKYLRNGERWDAMYEKGAWFGTSLTETSIMCVMTKKEYDVFYGSDYMEYKSKLIYINGS